ncbi:hypothetical protein PPACK8108_LOCUS10561 [Phakopsora pachyrhizi]|uniref:Secreted protein n=1 Tax=Phakopsora pachyrhizi TaxID=170000 RepID=A0AAV0B0K4_PHAPC|nr:hypothetical protein PPACK8108_LOCUS10561 [Phakopsora pachyrhizi]
MGQMKPGRNLWKHQRSCKQVLQDQDDHFHGLLAKSNSTQPKLIKARRICGALPIVLCLMFMISNISALATHTSKLEKRNSPDGLFTDCRNAVIKQGCNAALDDLWNNGKIKRFTTEHQYANHPSGCKLTWWTDGGVTRPADDQKYTLQNALQKNFSLLYVLLLNNDKQIDDSCTSSGLSSVYDSNRKGNGVYVGKLLTDYFLGVP